MSESLASLASPLGFLTVTLQAVVVALVLPGAPVRIALPIAPPSVTRAVQDEPVVTCPVCGQCVAELRSIIDLQGSLAFWWALSLGLIAVLIVAILALCCSLAASVLRRRLPGRKETDVYSAPASTITPATRRALAQK
jgi:hypothetical protein